MSIIESRRNTGVEHFIIQGGDCKNFDKGAALSVGKKVKLLRAGKIGEGQSSVGYYAGPKGLLKAKKGDLMWVMKSNDNRYAYAVVEIESVSLHRSFSSIEMGWSTDGTGEVEVIYTNLIRIRDCQIQLISGQPGNCVLRNYKTSISITADLPAEYDLIQRYRHAHIGL
jgi:hypothetical protein